MKPIRRTPFGSVVTNSLFIRKCNFCFRAEGRTHCVDTTITNILEGRVSYVPEKENSKTESSSDAKITPARVSNEVGIFHGN